MPAGFVAYLVSVLAAPFALLGILAFALLRRYRRRRIPNWAKWSGALLTGFCLSPAFILLPEPIWLILLLLPLAWIAFLLGRSGRFRLAGLMVLGLTVPGAFWLGALVYAKVPLMTGFSGYEPYFRFVLATAGTLVGIGMVLMGDHAAPARLTRPPDTPRDPMTLANAMAAGIAVGPFNLPSLVAEGVAFVVTAIAVTAATTAGLPWPVVVLGAGLLYMVISTELWYLAFPADARAAWAGFAYIGHIEQERWRATTGTEPPYNDKLFRQWLATNTERPETRWAHAEMLAVVGRLEEARAMAERIEAETPAEAFDRDAMLTYIDWIDGQEIDFDERLRAAEAIGAPGSPERLFARGSAAISLARERAATHGDWMTPLGDFDRQTGHLGWAYLRQDTRRKRMTATFLLGLLVGLLFTVPAMLLGEVL
ncbi:MAG TPA: hypothetical protein VFY43_00785 [Candidatus Limnocylindria bacterium]|nr:hypothetical protein [Candidatus Limnocylindria bacterium]